MKVQEVKRECTTATVGISVELSNTEINSKLCEQWKLEQAIDRGIEQAKAIAKAAEKPYDTEEDIPVSIPLRTLMRIDWFFSKIASSRMMSDVFCEANSVYNHELQDINKVVVKDESQRYE